MKFEKIRMTPCNGCGANMVFIEQRNGKKHPCNPEPVVSGELEMGDKMIADDGRIIVIKEDTEQDIHGHLSHFSTCPNADEFRKN